MKAHYIPNPIPIAIHPKALEATGYDVERVIEANEPPLQRALRIAGAGYFDRVEVKKKMRALQLRHNSKAGLIQFIWALFGVENYYRAQNLFVIPLRVVTKLITWASLSTVTFLIFGHPAVSFLCTSPVLFLVSRELSFTEMEFESWFRKSWGHYFRWFTELNLRHYSRPMPQEVVSLATEIGMRVPNCEFSVIELDSPARRDNRVIRDLGGVVSNDRIVFHPPDPFLIVRLRNSYLPKVDGGVRFTAEEFVVAYWQKATWDSKVELPAV